MPVEEVAAGPTLKSTVNLPSETQNEDGDGDGDGDPAAAAAYDDDDDDDDKEMKDQKIMTTSTGFNLLQSIKEDDKVEEDEEEEEIMSGSDDTCSIGECSSVDDDDETREDELQSKQISDQYLIQIKSKSSLTSLDSLEESLPIKRGLSNFYSGKSKSFTSLSNAANATAKDLVKPENPLNKRRRLLIAWSRNRRASCSSLVSIAESESPLMPLQRLPSVVSECEEEEEEEEEESSSSFSPSERMRRDKEKRRPSLFTVTVAPPQIDHDHDHDRVLSSISIGKMALRSPGRSLSLSDLNQHAHAHAMTNLD